MLGAILLGGVGLLWLVFAFAESAPSGQAGKASGATPGPVTNIGIMPPGQQVNPVDQWVGTAGSKLAQYESEREEQGRLNKDRQAFEARTMQRFAELEQRLTATTQAVQAPVPTPAPAAPAPSLPPPSALPPPPSAPRGPAAGAVPAMPPGAPPVPLSSAPAASDTGSAGPHAHRRGRPRCHQRAAAHGWRRSHGVDLSCP